MTAQINPDNQQYLYYGQFERTTELNKRIYERTLMSDIPLRPNMDSRPMETRHVVFQMVSSSPPPIVPIRKYLEYDTSKTFSSIQSNAPVDGYLNNIDKESCLRNQFYGLQHGAIQTTYVPSSKSDLYVVQLPNNVTNTPQPFPLLFEKETYRTSGNENVTTKIGKNIFNNATKQQLRGM